MKQCHLKPLTNGFLALHPALSEVSWVEAAQCTYKSSHFIYMSRYRFRRLILSTQVEHFDLSSLTRNGSCLQILDIEMDLEKNLPRVQWSLDARFWPHPSYRRRQLVIRLSDIIASDNNTWLSRNAFHQYITKSFPWRNQYHY